MMQLPTVWTLWLITAMTIASTAFETETARCITYLTGQHDVIPTSKNLVNDITHVVLAFMRSEVFNVDETPAEFPFFTTVDKVRSQMQPGTKVMVAIGGWGDSKGFEEAALNNASRSRWARQVKAMVDMTGADGVDIDWEYPGGNRDDYKQIPNFEREWEISAFVLLLRKLRDALGDKLISIAVPALKRDLMAFSSATIPQIIQEVDFINVMTYDMMNRRDTKVTHHSGVDGSRETMKWYILHGAPPQKLNLGLGYYVKWFMTKDCNPEDPLGCPTELLEDPDTGADLGKAGAFSWHDKVPTELAASFARAQNYGTYFDDGSYGFWDAADRRWWSYDTPEVLKVKVPRIVGELGLGGVFAWGLGEDAPSFTHLKTILGVMRELNRRRALNANVRDEL